MPQTQNLVWWVIGLMIFFDLVIGKEIQSILRMMADRVRMRIEELEGRE